ncbi:hypothetical protein WJX74_001346 [Apatococcus lobatus]|uniref:Acyl-CoA desaturase n=1 Tax=Apatococcus lobatus TaxID=904363 RepID=A0AAW1RCX1_9CHLO
MTPTVALSYAEQFDYLVALPKGSVNFRAACRKPSLKAQAADPRSYQLPFSSVFAQPKHSSRYNNHWGTTVFMIWIHGMCCLGPATYSLGLALITIPIILTFGLGIEMVFHRMLCHKSFTTPKWLEYFMAYIGSLNIQGDPIEWVSDHRYHHQHTDTPMDPHSPYEGFWWAHIGWLWDNEALWPQKGAFDNANDLKEQPFYAFIQKTYWWHIGAQFLSLWLLGGLPAFVWLGCIRIVVIFHVTFAVNSAAHIWGTQEYQTNDLSKNCAWIALLSLGEWHNNHHAFEGSANTGLEHWQFDMTYQIIKGMSFFGLASNIKLPSEASKAKLLLQAS